MEYIQLLYLALPCFLANIIPVLADGLNLFPSLKKPLDNNKTIFKKRIFGSHKTWRGLILGVTIAIIVSLLQYFLAKTGLIKIEFLSNLEEFILFGFLAGLGAILGDAIESFFKRQLNIPSGEPFIVFDQIDYILGFILFTSLLIPWSLEHILELLVFSLIAHPISNFIAYIFKLKKTYL